MNVVRILFMICLAVTSLTSISATASLDSVYSGLPIKEVTVFKDGHAYLLHEGTLQVDAEGKVVLSDLPTPIMGTFWANSTDPKRKLKCIVSSRDKVTVEKTPTSIEELLKSNPDGQIIVTETTGQAPYQAAIIRILEEDIPETTDETTLINYYNATVSLQKIVLLKTTEGIKALPINQIRSITFLGNPNQTTSQQQIRDTMTLQLETKDPQQSNAEVGMAYIQRGIRWIPSYRVEIDGKGNAVIKLQGTIINELADLTDTVMHLVVGVPRFAFQDTPDPISFQETVAQLSRHMRADSRTSNFFSNAAMSQAGGVYLSYENEDIIDLGPELKGSQGNEDLFVFSLDHITLKKGQRMVLPIAEYTLPYQDIYTVDIQLRPPLEMRQNFNSNQQLELAKLLHAPKAVHKIRLTNKAQYPLTTAPATIFKNDKVLAQGMMKFTSIGGKGDLEITDAIDIKVKNSDKQVQVTPNAVEWNGDRYSKIDMLGTVALTNFSDKTVTVNVKRSVLGNVVQADHDGHVKQSGHGYDSWVFEEGAPVWWSWCNWPWWWYRFNSIGQASWDVEIEPKEEITLEYNWHYFWR